MTTKPYTTYAQNVEAEALRQFNSAMELDCVVAGALMPDAHTGYTLPIGAVVATDGIIFPSWVGYDIGCGMCALPTTFDAEAVDANAVMIQGDLHRDIPTGFNKHKHPQSLGDISSRTSATPTKRLEEVMVKRDAGRQLGTLGGGNHFIEVGRDEHNKAWIIIHSGSRGVGHGTATEYMRLASPDGKGREGHYGFEEGSENGMDYIRDLKWCLAYALANRLHMMEAAIGTLSKYCRGEGLWDELINRNHNHAEKRLMAHAGGLRMLKPYWIHRKGATHAEAGMKGVIPGNMRDGSYIVTGKGNPDALWSSSHGAGRLMSRKKARETLDLNNFKGEMINIVCDADAKRLDEAPGAYKSIHAVMDLQTDLVHVDAYVEPILNVKG